MTSVDLSLPNIQNISRSASSRKLSGRNEQLLQSSEDKTVSQQLQEIKNLLNYGKKYLNMK